MIDNTDMQDKRKIIKYRILDYIESHLKYYVTDKEERKKEKQKLFDALKDLFDNVPLEQMSDNNKFCENGRFDYLMRKCRKHWGEKFLIDIHDIIVSRI